MQRRYENKGMKFEERDLPLWSVPLALSDLQVGITYFVLSFVDDEMHVPELRPVVFAGADLNGEGEGRLYFQDFASFERGTRYVEGTVDFEGTFDTCSRRWTAPRFQRWRDLGATA